MLRSLVLLIVSLLFINKAWHCIPGELLFLFTSDAFEVLFATILGLILYTQLFSEGKIGLKFFLITFSLAALLAIAILKSYRRGQNDTSIIFSDTMSYVGLTFVFTFLFYLFDNLDLILNNTLARTKKELVASQNRLLRQQFNPHFLFNAFNSLYSMSIENSPKVTDTILKLSGMMRYMTDDVGDSKALLDRELEFIKDFIEIQRIRFGSSSNIKLNIKGETRDKFIEPLLYISLVENAFKHGFYTNDDRSFVHISITIDDHKMLFECINSSFEKQHFQEQVRDGKGLENLRRRLALSYPSSHKLTINEEEGFYKVKLILDHE